MIYKVGLQGSTAEARFFGAFESDMKPVFYDKRSHLKLVRSHSDTLKILVFRQ